MTTTYELYTNENGTPKLVEGKAPAIIERVETLEETLDKGVVTSVNGKTGIVSIDVGVTSFNGSTGAVTYSAPVTSVNGQTGEVSIPTGHNVGEEWVSYTGKIPNGGVPYCGQTVTRATYADLWTYAQAQGLVKTEAEWQSWASSHGGNVPYYSSGNGSSTFRMPKIVGYVKGASSQSEAGGYVAEGLPNITGSFNPHGVVSDDGNYLGAFTCTNDMHWHGSSGNDTYSSRINFDASLSNPIYGNSNHVTPETSVVMFGVYAFGAIVETGALDATTLATGLATVEANLEDKLEKTTAHIVETWKNGTNWYRKWSDGWIEQGGIHNPSSTTITTISLHKAMATTSYQVQLTINETTGNNCENGAHLAYNKTTTNFKYKTWSNYNCVAWRVYGY